MHGRLAGSQLEPGAKSAWPSCSLGASPRAARLLANVCGMYGGLVRSVWCGAYVKFIEFNRPFSEMIGDFWFLEDLFQWELGLDDDGVGLEVWS